MSGRGMNGSLGVGPLEVEVGERVGDVRVRLVAKVGARVARLLEQLVRVVEEMHELLRRGLVALLLEERPGVLVEGDAVDGVPLASGASARTRSRRGCSRRRPKARPSRTRRPRSCWSNSQLPICHQISATYFGSAPGRSAGCGMLWQSAGYGSRNVTSAPPFASATSRRGERGATPTSTASSWSCGSGTIESVSGFCGLGAVGYGEVVVADERAPDLLRLVDPARVVVGVPEEVIDGRELAVLRKLADDALVERRWPGAGLARCLRDSVSRARSS